MDYLDFDLKIGAGSGQDYPVEVVSAPAGAERATMHFPFDDEALKTRLQAVEIALLKSGSTRRAAMLVQEHTSVEAFGRELFDALLPAGVLAAYRQSRAQAVQEGKGLRLRLRIEAPELAALPWEFLYDDAEGDFVCLSNETPVTRYLELERPTPPLTIEPPLRILGMVASPTDKPPLDVEREKARMEQALESLVARGLVTLTWLGGQTWRDLLEAMRQGPWHVFHFVGHGGFDPTTEEGLIALADENGQTYRLPATKLGRLLADHNALRLAILNACQGAQASDDDLFSSAASVLSRRGIPAVIAMQYEITDRAAIEFSRVFYEALADGMPVDAAVAEGRKAISLSLGNTVEWGTPVLMMRSPDGRLFDVKPGAVPPPAPPPAAVQHAPEPPSTPPVAEAPPPEPAPKAAPTQSVGRTVKRIVKIGLIVAAVLVVLVIAIYALAINDSLNVVEEQRQALAQVMASQGFAVLQDTSQIPLNTGAQIKIPLGGLAAGDQVHGFTDDMAQDLDLRLLDANNQIQARDEGAGTRPVVAVPRAGTYAVELDLQACESGWGSCYVGFSVLRNGAAATGPPDAAPPPSTTPATPPADTEAPADTPPVNPTPQNVRAAFTIGEEYINEAMDFATLKPIEITLDLPDEGGEVWFGVDHCMLYSNQQGTRVIRSYTHPQTGDRFLTGMDDGQFFADQRGYTEGQTEGQVFRAQEPGTRPLVLLWNEAQQDAITLANPDTRRYLEANGYTVISTEGYVYPPDQCQD